MDKKLLDYVIGQTGVPVNGAMTTLNLLLKENCTIPFITRYRKEATGGLDEVKIQEIQQAADDYTEIEKRREFILKTIEKMEKLTPNLKAQILNASSLQNLEDIYAPYKSKRKTKAALAKEAGLEPLAKEMLITHQSLEQLENLIKEKFLNEAHKITTIELAKEGACDILIEMFASDLEVKDFLREQYWREGKLVSEKRKEAEKINEYDKYKDYFEFSQQIASLKEGKNTHRFMAMRRGFMGKVLKISIEFDEQIAVSMIEKKFFPDESLSCFDLLKKCAQKAYRVYLHSSLDLEIKGELKKRADEEAIKVFGVNLKSLLLQPYLGAKAVLGIDPGVRTGCKVVVIDQTGKLLFDTVIFPHPPKNDKEHSAKLLTLLVEKFKIKHIAIGNGTYGRETLAFVNQFVKKQSSQKIEASMISEAGASIYSTSAIARGEFPDKDPTVRGAVSIARRFQDPLAELVKIDPKSIGVGQYQHDVNQVKLKKSLGQVVESCVNFVGVDLNTASAPLLSFVSGIGPKVAENIVHYRREKGSFKKREELLKVSRFSEKVFEQAAGFLRIYGGEYALDGTFIHPERYGLIEAWLKEHGHGLEDILKDKTLINKMEKDQNLRKSLGEFTHKDIITSLKAPSQDPRVAFETTAFREDITDIKDLKIGQWYPGIVTNITQFGAFVDIGIKENGLLHVSQIMDKFVENALDVLSVGATVKVRVMDLDLERKRISLSCKKEEEGEGRKTYHSSSQGKTRPRQHSTRREPAKLRNNAFAALKGLKIKG